MAKIRVHGTVLVTVRKEFPLRQNVIDSTVCIHVKALMSDGVSLEKHSFVRSDKTRNNGQWKKIGKVKAEFATPVAWLALQERMGFELVGELDTTEVAIETQMESW